MSTHTIEANDLKEAVMSLIRYFEFELGSLERKSFNTNIIETLNAILNDVKEGLKEVTYIGGPVINESLEKLFNKMLEIHSKLSMLKEESTVKEFGEIVESFRNIVNEFKETIAKQKIVIIRRRRTLLSLLAFIALIFTVNYHLFYLLIAGLDVRSVLFITDSAVPMLSLAALALVVLEAYLIVKHAKYVVFPSLALTIMCSYIAYLTLTTVLLLNPSGAHLLKITSLLVLGLCTFFMLMTFGYNSLATLPKAKIKVKIGKIMKPVKTIPKEVSVKVKSLYEALIKTFKDVFGDLGEEILKYEIDHYMFSGLTFEEAVRKVAERLSIKSTKLKSEEEKSKEKD
ncbi:MAG: hypothetical protein DRO23_09970 [Thermoprotei archaeon]|nr:MAG: hypothetical protein DRO23_09970 [Thermoprotei archaeon]